MHFLLAPLVWFAAGGRWLNDVVLTPFSLGMTAKQIFEEQLGVYGVQAFLIYKTCRLLIDYFPLVRPRWLVGRALRAVALCGSALVLSYLATVCYIGVLLDPLQLEVSYGGMLAAAVVAWVALAYHYARKAIDRAREAAEAEELEEE